MAAAASSRGRLKKPSALLRSLAEKNEPSPA
ncbi:hypothetical protein CCACVL1_29396 [Corchorus capsularis]|uniref:Uncharacterized protein n=1 Tax=Corchorus capsularis TaxID=210143 RepID=A0A1R3G1W0_COCAP|nr:hypothetical protein CCACVL1_29396 [Corchorus capsularis]